LATRFYFIPSSKGPARREGNSETPAGGNAGRDIRFRLRIDLHIEGFMNISGRDDFEALDWREPDCDQPVFRARMALKNIVQEKLSAQFLHRINISLLFSINHILIKYISLRGHDGRENGSPKPPGAENDEK
jgi:hypothetical protein